MWTCNTLLTSIDMPQHVSVQRGGEKTKKWFVEGGYPTVASACVMLQMSKTVLRGHCVEIILCHSLSMYLPTSTPFAADRGQWSG